jgi:hypothetical protein
MFLKLTSDLPFSKWRYLKKTLLIMKFFGAIFINGNVTPFNRTIEELKFVSSCFLFAFFIKLLIALEITVKVYQHFSSKVYHFQGSVVAM